MKHSAPQKLDEIAERFERWADEVDPETLDAEGRVEHTEDLRDLAEAVDAASVAQARIAELVAVSRARGRSWGEIGIALGVSRQAARSGTPSRYRAGSSRRSRTPLSTGVVGAGERVAGTAVPVRQVLGVIRHRAAVGAGEGRHLRGGGHRGVPRSRARSVPSGATGSGLGGQVQDDQAALRGAGRCDACSAEAPAGVTLAAQAGRVGSTRVTMPCCGTSPGYCSRLTYWAYGERAVVPISAAISTPCGTAWDEVPSHACPTSFTAGCRSGLTRACDLRFARRADRI